MCTDTSLASADSPQQPNGNENAREVFDWQLKGGDTPSLSLIAESVQWVLLRHQETLTFMPPDVTLTADKLTVDVRTPMLLPHSDRKNLLSTSITGLSLNATISQSSQSIPGGPSGGGPDSENDTGNAKKISSLSGALIQLRVVAKHVVTVLHLDNTADGDQPSPSVVDPKGKGTLLAAGLPAYPIGDEGSVRTSSHDEEDEEEAEEPAADEERSVEDDSSSRFAPPAVLSSVTPHKVTAGGLKPLPGETILEAMRRQQQQAMDDTYNTPVSTKVAPQPQTSSRAETAASTSSTSARASSRRTARGVRSTAERALTPRSRRASTPLACLTGTTSPVSGGGRAARTAYSARRHEV